ncbi:hypothetical protein SAMN02745206_02243 [Desulfacinum infernum DSM 9756]|uniref:Uncharacterized protein n=1 Tax=Desulfacinum infernum DSM 9756 TaxID=1121391 RepID=A0A1M5CL61_9BACT|nr:hypothetical protein [Desulfacinum infernum]SHF55515.1 hypothetical protein SAMN02745206_02243 [Desulfacinum infernum DSM 9756]
MTVKDVRVHPLSVGTKGLDIFVEVENMGNLDFMGSPPYVPTLNVKIRDNSSGKEEQILSEAIPNLARSTTFSVVPRYEIKGFLETGHRSPKHGECKAEQEITVWIHTFPATYQDGTPANDDCDLTNNQRKTVMKYMVQCPW